MMKKITFVLIVSLLLPTVLLAQSSFNPYDPQGSIDAVLGPGDRLLITIYDKRTFSDPGQHFDITINESGRIALPIIGDLMVFGRTPEQLEKKITDALKEYVSNPIVFVHVHERVSKRALLIGEFRSQGLYPIRAGMTITEFIALNGGVNPTADMERIYIIRASGEIFHVDLSDYFEFGNIIQDITLEAGDKIYAPSKRESWIVTTSRWLSALTLALQVVILSLVINNN